jgi:hypothetical protein
MPGLSLPKFMQPDVAGSVPAHNMLSESPDPFAGLAAPAVPQYVMAPRHNVDPKADDLASGHYAEPEHEHEEGSKVPEYMHQAGDVAIEVAEHAGVHGLGGLNTFMGPLAAMFGYHELMEGVESGDSYKVMSGGAGLIGGGATTVEMLGSLVSGVTGTAAEAGALAGVAPVAGAAGMGLATGHAFDKFGKYDSNAHGYFDGKGTEEHRIEEGEKVDGNGEHTWKGGLMAAWTALKDTGLSLNNNGITGIGGSAGAADVVVAQQRAAEKSKMENDFYDSMKVTEEPSMSVKGY